MDYANRMKTIVYIDGYNLYYGLLRKSPHKWLDIYALFAKELLDTNSELVEVRYYTAPILRAMSDDPAAEQRQRQYLQALRKFRAGQVHIIEGKMSASKPYKRPVYPTDGQHLIQVHDFEEKKTDVNIATDMLCDVWRGRCEQVVLCSNDSDQEPTLKAIRTFHPDVRIGLALPIKEDRHSSNGLVRHADWQKRIKSHHLENAQLPIKIPHTSIKQPETWR
jgi:uncharacterized LabA/DUF88 family protein